MTLLLSWSRDLSLELISGSNSRGIGESSKLRELILLLAQGQPLPPRYKDHPLSGDWKYFRDCPIEADWLLIYNIDGLTMYTWSAPERTRTCFRGVAYPNAPSERNPRRAARDLLFWLSVEKQVLRSRFLALARARSLRMTIFEDVRLNDVPV
jgi:YafQ family addiction module toxin component